VTEADDPIARKLLAAVNLHGAGQQAEAERLYREIVEAEPGNADAWHLLGIVAYQRRDFPAAAERIRKAIGLADRNATFFSNLGLVLQAQGKLSEAILQYRRAVSLNPGYADALYNLGNALLQSGELEEAAASYRRAVAANPEFVEAHNNLGNLLRRLGRPEEAVACYRQALALQPKLAETRNNLGNALKSLHRLDEAIASYNEAIALQPGFADAHNNLGNAFQQQNRTEAAIAEYQRALAIKPELADAWNNLGSALYGQSRLGDAEAALRRAVALDGRHVKAHLNLGLVLQALGRHADAARSYDRVVELDPGHADARLRRFNLNLHVSDWTSLDSDAAEIKRLIAADKIVADPYFLMFVPGVSAAEQRRAAEAYARQRFAPVGASRHCRADAEHGGDRKLRLGYLSTDFREHAVAYLLAEIIELHDRSRFEVLGYSLGADDVSAMRRRLRTAFDEFHDLEPLSAADAAARIASGRIDILVDLNGYTGSGRPEILAARPAPVQASYLGYPGTMGADFVDYLMADRFVCPPGSAADYTETLACLPDCFQPNDRKRPIGAPPTRRDYGLPEHGFVFCAFNANYKITPAMFGAWMSLMRDIPDSVLWLAESKPAKANLRRAAAVRGVTAERLVFSPKVPMADHLARYALADLFLDTLPYNAHATASDALWGGLPVLTCAGETYAGRVGGSLLHAVGLPELIAGSLEDYVRIARHLATHRDELGELRSRLARHRASCPLFDAPRRARQLEALYERMWRTFVDGRPPSPIDLGADTA
jgi:protein O-GlcNAc transferase